MDNIFRYFRSFFNQNSNENNDEDAEPRHNIQPVQSFVEDDDEMQRAIAESKREYEEMENAKKQKERQKQMEDMEALQYSEIQSVVFDNAKLADILKKLPGVDPDDRIFNEFYFSDTKY